jgi:hypothetical protein
MPSKKKAAGVPPGSLADELRAFCEFGTPSIVDELTLSCGPPVPVFINEFWTAGQRQAHSLHEISYRACFKPQLPRFFIQRLTRPGDIVYDPFMGRGTTLVEAALMGRIPWGCDINPLSPILIRPRIEPPEDKEIVAAVESLPLDLEGESRQDLLAFYHPDVLRAVSSMRHWFHHSELDTVGTWLRMVATNRLTGHSPGFFSVYSLPPNQAVSIKSQIRINEKRSQVPPPRNVRGILRKKSTQLLKDLTPGERATLAAVAPGARLLTASCDHVPALPDNSITLAVTSPPFLNEVQYDLDNWLRCWFNHIDSATVPIWMLRRPDQWQEKMTGVLRELRRTLVPGGHVACEVGEVRGGKVKLEELVIPAARAAGLEPLLVMINAQEFTKTSNCWGISNQSLGTNTNRIVLLRKS